MPDSVPIKVAVVGGGCAAMTTAFELSDPVHDGRYQVTVYQLGWRLGGKGASGRGPAGRIEEHGLHVWLGFYENAFQLLRKCYEEMDRPDDHPFAGWQDAFFQSSHVGVAERVENTAGSGDSWEPWTALFPPDQGLPGDPMTDYKALTLTDAAVRTIDLLRALLLGMDRAASTPVEPDGDYSVADALQSLLRIAELSVLSSVGAMAEALAVLAVALRSLPTFPYNLLLKATEKIARSARELLIPVIATDPEFARRWEIIDLCLAILVGAVRHNLLLDPRGLDAINHYECRDWLRENGASEAALNCGFVRGLYDLALAYEDGDPAQPKLAAGQAVRGSIRMFFTYRGALFWKMRGSMGDLLFAPLYEVLRRRGVKFKFFHKLTNLKLSEPGDLAPGERAFIKALEFDVQAQTRNEQDYRPLIHVKNCPAWPAQPDYEQLKQGQQLAATQWDPESHWDTRRASQLTLEVSKDFDFLVLGLSVGAVSGTCKEIIARDVRWQNMIEKVKTVATQACQIWLNEDMSQMGWHEPPVTLSAFKKPFDTWADMSHLADLENWGTPPKSIAYFCGVLADASDGETDFQQRQNQQVKNAAKRLLTHDLHQLWPAAKPATGNGVGFRWSALQLPDREDDARIKGEARFESQYWRANVNPTDRYVLALPGSLQYRISPLDNTYDNMTVAGDWTDCGFNEGCVEAAVMSGRLAAHAISHLPPLEDIIGYDYP